MVTYSSASRRIGNLAHELKTDDDASQKVQVLIVKCGGNAEVINDWCDAENFSPPIFEADGGTPLGEAVRIAASELESQKQAYRDAGVSYLKPWLFIISDGAPTDNWQGAADDLVQKERDGKWTTFPIAVEGADVDVLGQFALRDALQLEVLNSKLFSGFPPACVLAHKKQTITKMYHCHLLIGRPSNYVADWISLIERIKPFRN